MAANGIRARHSKSFLVSYRGGIKKNGPSAWTPSIKERQLCTPHRVRFSSLLSISSSSSSSSSFSSFCLSVSFVRIVSFAAAARVSYLAPLSLSLSLSLSISLVSLNLWVKTMAAPKTLSQRPIMRRFVFVSHCLLDWFLIGLVSIASFDGRRATNEKTRYNSVKASVPFLIGKGFPLLWLILTLKFVVFIFEKKNSPRNSVNSVIHWFRLPFRWTESSKKNSVKKTR